MKKLKNLFGPKTTTTEDTKTFVLEAIKTGYSWGQIGKMLGVSRERVMQISGLKISKKLRKEVLTRDNHKCVYCPNDASFVSKTTPNSVQLKMLESTCRQCFYQKNYYSRAQGFRQHSRVKDSELQDHAEKIASGLGIKLIRH